MAKSTTSRSKTKTTRKSTAKKKPAAKRSSKAAASKSKTAAKKATASKAASKKAAAKKAVSKTTKKDIWASLKQWNLGLAVLHGAQAVVMAILAKDFKLPLDVNYLTQNVSTNQLDTASRTIADVPLAWLVIAFFAMSSIAHFIIAGPWWKGYKADLEKGMNRARWFEYALSASTMMVAIGMLVGITSLSLLISIFALTAGMNLMGYIMETTNQKNKDVNWSSFWIGTFLGVIPWIIVSLYFLSNWLYGNGNPPTFVYFIYVSIFVAFMSFAVNMRLQYRRKGKWADYLHGEKVYMFLSLAAKSALAWQVFAGTLR